MKYGSTLFTWEYPTIRVLGLLVYVHTTFCKSYVTNLTGDFISLLIFPCVYCFNMDNEVRLAAIAFGAHGTCISGLTRVRLCMIFHMSCHVTLLIIITTYQCWKFLSPGRPRRSGLGLGDLFPEVGSPGGRPEMAISRLLRGLQTSMTTRFAVQRDV